MGQFDFEALKGGGALFLFRRIKQLDKEMISDISLKHRMYQENKYPVGRIEITVRSSLSRLWPRELEEKRGVNLQGAKG